MTTTSAQYTIGIDLGGTNTVFGIVDKDGNIVCESSIKTQDYPLADDFVKASIDSITPLINEIGGIHQIRGMGIGAPCANFNTGCIEYPPNLAWSGITPLAQMFTDQLGIPVRITNDANAAAMGEMVYGAARGMKDFILITLGTGVGSGIVANGKMVVGHDGLAGELGHVRIDTNSNARLCTCGRCGCLEAYCSARGIVATAKELCNSAISAASAHLHPLLSKEKLTPFDIYIAAKEGDETARQAFHHTGKILGMACADFTAFCNPQAFIFFGGPMKAHEYIMPGIIEGYESHVMPIFRRRPEFLLSELMDKNVAVLGAASLV